MKISNAMYPVPAGFSGITKMQAQYADLQTQLATGLTANTLADMGQSRFTDLAVRSKLNQISSYDNNITTINLRLEMMNQAMSSLTTVQSDARTASAVGGYGTSNINLTTAPSQAQARLDQVLTTLNTDVNGHYLFGGSTSDKAPVATLGPVLDGVNGLAGFKTVAAQRLQADQGNDGSGGLTGRLTVTTAADTVTVADDASPFGFKLSSLTADGSSPVLTQPSGSPASLSVQFTTQPTAGQQVSIGLALPDGSTDSVALKAVTGTPANPGEYQIGATPAATATNFSAALNASLQTKITTTLAVASNYAAANNFFNGQGQTVQRVAGPPYDTATGLTPATVTDTVLWYQGQDSAGAARRSVSTKVDSSTSVSYGVEANESGFLNLVRSLAVQAIQSYPTSSAATTAQSQAKFDAVAAGQASLLSDSHNSNPGSLQVVSVDLGLAQTTLSDVTARHKAYSAQLQDTLANSEQADTTTVAAQLLALQTRLQASYQATSIISQLTLANYIK